MCVHFLLPFFMSFTFALNSLAQTAPAGISTGLVLWLDGSDVNGNDNNPSDGSSVSTWVDKSGLGNHAEVYTEQNPATYVTGQINGKAVIRFTRVNDYYGSVLKTNVDIRPMTSPDVTMFTVYKQGTHGATDIEAPWGADNGNWDRFFISAFQGNNGVAPFGPASPYYTPVTGSGLAGQVRLLTAVYDGQVTGGVNSGPASSSAIYYNGKLVTSFTDKTHVSDEQPNLYIGWDGDNSAFNGDIAEVICYKRRLSECEIITVNKYLAGKYGQDFNIFQVSVTSGDTDLGAGESVVLTSTTGSAYKWLRNEVAISGATNNTYTATTAGDYKVVVTSAAGCTDTSAAITVTSSHVNTAPVVNTSTVSLPGLAEDVLDVNNTGILVSDLLSGTVSDVDGEAIGIAVTSRDANNGTWQFLESGIWWNFDRHAVASESQALLLSPATKIRFIPAINYNGTAVFTYRAWDQTSGTDHNITSTASNGGTTAFSSGTGTASVSISSINDAPVINSVIGVPTVAFDGANDHISFTNPAVGGDYTIEAWVYVTQHQTWSRVADLGNGSGNNNIIFGFQGGTNKLFMESFSGATGGGLASPSAFPTGVWKHVACVNNGTGTGYLYIDGVLVASGAQNVPPAIARSLNYFARSNWGQDSYFRGAMREMRIWDIARSQSEISQNMDKPLLGNENGLRVYYRTDENAGTTLNDASGFGRNGSMMNGASWSTFGSPLTNLIVQEDTERSIPGFQMVDPDAGNNNVTLTISSTKGMIRFLTNVTGGLTAGEITGNNSYAVTINSTIAKINATLDASGYIYSPDANYYGPGKVNMGLTDNGFSGAGGVLSTTYAFDVTIAPVNDVPVITSTPLVTSVNEDDVYSYTVTATDIDVEDVLTYSASVLPAWLTIDANTGVLTGTPRNQDVGMHNVTVRVFDGKVYVAQSFSITVVNTNDAPVVDEGIDFSIDENTANGTVVGTATAGDEDQGAVLGSWTIVGGNTNNAFKIDPVTGVITVNDSTVLDFEKISFFDLVVTVSDGMASSQPQTIRITVNDVNEAPVVTKGIVVNIDENGLSGTVVVTATATDPDEGATLMGWAIAGGNVDNAFAIDPSTGVITVSNSAALDYEKITSFTLLVTVSDGDLTSKTESIVIHLNNLNDNRPVITPGQNISVDENRTPGSVAGTVLATDADGPTTFSNWTIVSGNTNDAFRIDPATGIITVNNFFALDYETQNTFELVITVSDGVNTSFTEIVTITLNDLLENSDGNPVIYTGFSPDGDGVNDTWNIPNLDMYPNSVVKIFNTDGIELFSNTGYTQQWDGKYNGKEMPIGTYYYLIRLNDTSNTIYKGHLMIIKE